MKRLLRRCLAPWDMPFGWALLWRAQAAHLAIYVLIPAAWAVVYFAFAVATLPLSIVSFADGGFPLSDRVLDHLDQPGCWIALAPCTGPASQVLGRALSPTTPCPDVPAVLKCRAYTDGIAQHPSQTASRIAWVVLAGFWIWPLLRARTRREEDAAPPPG